MSLDIFGQNDWIRLPADSNYTISNNPTGSIFELLIPNGKLIYLPDFIPEGKAAELLRYFMETDKSTDGNPVLNNIKELNTNSWKNIPWRQDAIYMFGKKVLQPRFTCWFADEGKSYTYSGLNMQPKPWDERLLQLKSDVEKFSKAEFNSVLMNAYRDGSDHMGWHADDEPELGRNPVIASLNFGAERRFLLRRNANLQEKIEILLRPGSLLLMEGALQHYWKHAVPKQLKVKAVRVNLTFRKII
ncbi:MAG: alpha-ketoglutarate-dependent dioxygenase AlkB family protein [Saprospiraceae bacterium]